MKLCNKCGHNTDQMAIYCTNCGSEMTNQSPGAAMQNYPMPRPRKQPIAWPILRFLGVIAILAVVSGGLTSFLAPSRNHPIVGTWEFMVLESQFIDSPYRAWIDTYHADGTGTSTRDRQTTSFTWSVEDDLLTVVRGFNGTIEETTSSFSFAGTRLFLYDPEGNWWERYIFRRVED